MKGFHRNFQENAVRICVNMFVAVLSANESILYEGIPPQLSGNLYRTLHQVPKVSTIEGFHCMQYTPPYPQGVHNRRIPLYLKE